MSKKPYRDKPRPYKKYCALPKDRADFNLSCRERNRAYRKLAEAMLRTVIQDGDLTFFRDDNPMKDVTLGLAQVTEDYAYELTNRARKEILKDKLLLKKKWNDMELAPLMKGELTVNEICLITNLSTSAIYKKCYLHPDWKYLETKGNNYKTPAREELINWWLENV